MSEEAIAQARAAFEAEEHDRAAVAVTPEPVAVAPEPVAVTPKPPARVESTTARHQSWGRCAVVLRPCLVG